MTGVVACWARHAEPRGLCHSATPMRCPHAALPPSDTNRNKSKQSRDTGDEELSVAACGSLDAETRCFTPESLPLATHAALCLVPDVPADIMCAFTSRVEAPAASVCGVTVVPGARRLANALRCMSLKVGPSGSPDGHLLAACRAVDAELLTPLGVTPVPVEDGDVPAAVAAAGSGSGSEDFDTGDKAAVATACRTAVRLLSSALAVARMRTSSVCGVPSATPCKASVVGAVVERVTLCHALAARTAAAAGSGATNQASTAADAVARVALSLRQYPLEQARVVNAVTPHLRPGGAADGPVSVTMLAAMQKFALTMLPAGGVRDVGSYFE